MSFNSGDMAFFFSNNGGPGDLRELNRGGVISTTEIVHSLKENFAPDIPRSVVGSIGTQGTWSMYFPFYLKNKHASIAVTDVKLHVLNDVNHINVDMQMGFAPAGLNGNAQVIANQTTAPSGVTFQNPRTVIIWTYTQETIWNVASTMAAGDRIALWIRLYGPKGVSSIPLVKFTLKAAFTRPA